MSRALSLSKVVLSILLACVFAGSSRAALLAEIGINVEPAFDASPPEEDSLSFGFVGGAPGMLGQFYRQVTAADVGLTFDAPLEVVDMLAQGITKPDAGINISMDRNSYSNSLDQLQAGAWAECCEIVTFRKFVPDITKVPINRLTMTINAFVFDRFGRDDAAIGGSHTVHIYGVPEPATSGGVLIFAGTLLWYRRIRRQLTSCLLKAELRTPTALYM